QARAAAAAQDDAASRAERQTGGGDRGGQRRFGLELVAHGAHEMAEQAIAQLGMRQRIVALPRCRQVAPDATGAAARAGLVAERCCDDGEARPAAILAAEP